MIWNLIVGWKVLRCSVNLRNETSPCVQIKNISSIYLFHRRGVRCCGAKESMESSSDPMNMLAYDGAIFVLMAVPCIWR